MVLTIHSCKWLTWGWYLYHSFRHWAAYVSHFISPLQSAKRGLLWLTRKNRTCALMYSVPTGTHHGTRHCWEEPGSVFFASSLQVFMDSDDIPLLQAVHSSSWWPFGGKSCTCAWLECYFYLQDQLLSVNKCEIVHPQTQPINLHGATCQVFTCCVLSIALISVLVPSLFGGKALVLLFYTYFSVQGKIL